MAERSKVRDALGGERASLRLRGAVGSGAAAQPRQRNPYPMPLFRTFSLQSELFLHVFDPSTLLFDIPYCAFLCHARWFRHHDASICMHRDTEYPSTHTAKNLIFHSPYYTGEKAPEKISGAEGC